MPVTDQHTVTLQVAADVEVIRRDVAVSVIGVAAVAAVRIVGFATDRTVGIESVGAVCTVSFCPAVAQLDTADVEVRRGVVAETVVGIAAVTAIRVVGCAVAGAVGIECVAAVCATGFCPAIAQLVAVGVKVGRGNIAETVVGILCGGSIGIESIAA